MADMRIPTDFQAYQSMDPRRAADSLLLKIALEGKSFQKARHEVEEAQSFPPGTAKGSSGSPPAPVTASEIPSGSFTVTEWEMDLQRMAITLQTQTETVSVTLTQARVHSLTATGIAQPQKKDPLVLDFSGSGPQTTGRNGARPFDLAGDGQVAPTSVATGRTAFLALDRNGNGRIDDGREFFGDQHGATDGYEELRRFDANADGVINASDPVFSNLQLLYGDGTLAPLASEGVQSLDLGATSAGGLTSGGDDILRSATAALEKGGTIGTYALALSRFQAEA